jgi:large subunit ribosomal protein L10
MPHSLKGKSAVFNETVYLFINTMGKTRAKKTEELDEVRQQLSKMKITILTYYSGLSVSEESKLRKTIREENAEYAVVKKTLLKIALKEKGIDSVALDQVNKPFGVTFGYGDESSTAKLLLAFQKQHAMVAFAGGVLDGAFLTATEITALAKLPTKQEMLGQLVRTIQAPVAGFVNVLRGNLSGLVTVLSSIRDQKA